MHYQLIWMKFFDSQEDYLHFQPHIQSFLLVLVFIFTEYVS